jgi:hypothetical protein
MAVDLDALYREYLVRFDREVGPCEVGAFAKYEGRLIKKLGRADFTTAFAAYQDTAERYHATLEAGDTVNDVVVKMLRDQAAGLILKPPGLP